MFFSLSPREVECFSKARDLIDKQNDQDEYRQATYMYEAVTTAIANTFGNQNIPWRKKTFTQEIEEANRTDEEKELADGLQFMKNLELSMEAFKATHKDVNKS